MRGATVDFDASQTGGKATVSLAQGALDLPGVFEEPVIPIDQLSGQAQWHIDGPALRVQFKDVHFANADAAGEAQVEWHTSDPATSPSHDRHPGVLDLEGRLTRANGNRVFRYLPLQIPKVTRDYVHDAVTHGTSSSVEFLVRGDLHNMPFADPKQGNFRIASKVADVTFDYVPQPAVSAASSTHPLPPHWPALTGLSGDLIFERTGMQVRNARGHVLGAAGIDIVKADATIADLSHHAPLLQVEAQARGPLNEALHATAPMVGDGAEMMKAVRATGNADYRLKLDLPLAALDHAKVQVGIALGGNELQLMPEAPAFTQARGTLNFTETGFSLAGVQARLGGGDVRVEGKGRYAGNVGNAGTPSMPELSFSALGTVTAEGLRSQQEVDWLARLASKASGNASYAANLSIQNGVPEFSLTSNLQGLGLQLPAPLEKAADQVLPLRVERKIVRRDTRPGAATPTLQDQLALELGRVVSARYLRDVSGSEARVLSGDIEVGLEGDALPVMPDRGVLAHLNLGRFDLDAWQAALGATSAPGPGALAARASTTSGAPAGKAPVNDATLLQAYLPSTVALRAQELSMGGASCAMSWRAVRATTCSGAAMSVPTNSTGTSNTVRHRARAKGACMPGWPASGSSPARPARSNRCSTYRSARCRRWTS